MSDPSAAATPVEVDPADYPRKVLFVAGAGRSGTSTLAGLMQIMGLHVPQPEVAADATNPKGFGEPRWVVDHHDRLLKDALVQVSDSRPDAWFETGRVSTREPERIATATWLDSHFGVNPELVVKDPRLAWFLGLWRVAAIRSGATPVFATMLRPPAEVVGSKQTYYANKLGAAHLAASWLNMLLHTERGTRVTVGDDAGSGPVGGRVFVRYADLLDDWTRTTMHVGERLGLQHVLHADSEAIRAGHRFVDPSLRRMSHSLDELALPPRLHELTAETWIELNKLAEPDGDTPEVHQALDALREAYVDLYAEAEAISASTVVATEQRMKRHQRLAPTASPGAAPAKPGPAATRPGATGPKPGPAGPVRRAADPTYAVDRVPHNVRAMVPAPVRRGLRRLAGRER